MKYKCEHCSKTFSTEKECREHEATHFPAFWKVELKYRLYENSSKFTITKVTGQKWDYANENITQSDGGDVIWLSKYVEKKKEVSRAREELREKAVSLLQDDIDRLTEILEGVKNL